MTRTKRISAAFAATARSTRSAAALGAAAAALVAGAGLSAHTNTVALAGRPAVSATAAASSPNWAGAVTSSRHKGRFQGAAGNWRVPRVTGRGYSCTWVGVDGYGEKHLIQTGTEEDYYGGQAHYYAWYEILPQQQTQTKIIFTATNTLVPVIPGDEMFAYVMRSGPGIWTIHLADKTQGWTYDHRFYYRTPERSAEWIQEGTMINGRYAAPAHFGSVRFTNMQIKKNGTWYYTRLGNRSRLNQVLRGRLYATAGRPSRGTPQAETVRYRG